MTEKTKKFCSDCIHRSLCVEDFKPDRLCDHFEDERLCVRLPDLSGGWCCLELTQGSLIQIPVKAGQTLYVLDEDKTILGLQIHSIDLSIGSDGIYDSDLELWDEESGNGYEYYDLDDIGKTLFLTREEAESKFNEREGTTS